MFSLETLSCQESGFLQCHIFVFLFSSKRSFPIFENKKCDVLSRNKNVLQKI